MASDEEFFELLEKGSDEQLIEYYKKHASHYAGEIGVDVRREMIKGVLDYRNAKKMIDLTKRLQWLTVALCLFTIALIYLTFKLQ